MAKIPAFLFSLVLAGAVAGCSMCPLFQMERAEIARKLPSGIEFADFVTHDWTGNVTVEEKLARLGAYVRGDGKLCDGAGRPIEFYRHSESAMSPGRDFEQRAQEQWQKLHERERKGEISVIEIRRDPNLPAPR